MLIKNLLKTNKIRTQNIINIRDSDYTKTMSSSIGR